MEPKPLDASVQRKTAEEIDEAIAYLVRDIPVMDAAGAAGDKTAALLAFGMQNCLGTLRWMRGEDEDGPLAQCIRNAREDDGLTPTP